MIYFITTLFGYILGFGNILIFLALLKNSKLSFNISFSLLKSSTSYLYLVNIFVQTNGIKEFSKSI